VKGGGGIKARLRIEKDSLLSPNLNSRRKKKNYYTINSSLNVSKTSSESIIEDKMENSDEIENCLNDMPNNSSSNILFTSLNIFFYFIKCYNPLSLIINLIMKLYEYSPYFNYKSVVENICENENHSLNFCSPPVIENNKENRNSMIVD
jgi:hypothetical protein